MKRTSHWLGGFNGCAFQGNRQPDVGQGPPFQPVRCLLDGLAPFVAQRGDSRYVASIRGRGWGVNTREASKSLAQSEASPPWPRGTFEYVPSELQIVLGFLCDYHP